MVLGMLADVPHQYPIVKGIILDILVGWILRGLPSLHLNIWLFRCVLHKQGFSASIYQAVAWAT